MGHLLLLSTIILSVNSAGSASTDPLQLSSSGPEQPLEKKTRFGDVGVNMRGVVTHHAGVACHTAIPVPVGRSYLTAAVTKPQAHSPLEQILFYLCPHVVGAANGSVYDHQACTAQGLYGSRMLVPPAAMDGGYLVCEVRYKHKVTKPDFSG